MQITKYCHNLGIAFQIQDDLLDLTADQNVLGKKIGLDIIEGKKTFLILTLMDRANSSEALVLIEDFFVNNGLPEARIKQMQKLMKEFGVFDIAREKSKNFFDVAKNEILKLEQNQYSEMLIWLLESIKSRDK